MKIQNEIEVAAPPDELFEILADVERVAPLLPGASLEGKENDDTYAGTVKVRVGPITTSYRGTIRFQELDHDSHRAVMRASGQEINGQGSTEATIAASVSGSDSKSVLKMDTDLEVRGKVAQFGRGAIGDVSQKILDQFAHNLESQVLSAREAEEEPLPSEDTSLNEKAEAPKTASARSTGTTPDEEESLDVLSVVGTPMLRKAVPVASGFVLGLLIGNFMRSRRELRAYQEIVRQMTHGLAYEYVPTRWKSSSR